MSKRALCLVFTSPAPGRDADFDAWYDRQIDGILSVPGWVGAQRYDFDSKPEGHGDIEPGWSHLVVYELQGDVGEAFRLLDEKLASGEVGSAPDGALAAGHACWVFTPKG